MILMKTKPASAMLVSLVKSTGDISDEECPQLLGQRKAGINDPGYRKKWAGHAQPKPGCTRPAPTRPNGDYLRDQRSQIQKEKGWSRATKTWLHKASPYKTKR